MWPFSSGILPWQKDCPENPQTYSEFMIHRMYHDRNPLLPKLEDKFAAREHVEAIGVCRLPELYHWAPHIPVRLPWNDLPERCVIKTNHWSGDGLFIMDGGKESLASVSREATIPEIYRIIREGKDQFGKTWGSRKIERKLGRLVKKHYPRPLEWATQEINPRGVMVEELLIDSKGAIPNDIKAHCFHGRVGFIQMDFDRFGVHTQNIYSPTGELIPQPKAKKKPNDDVNNIADYLGEDVFNRLITISEALSEGIDHIRVDLFLVDDEFVFGEYTAYHHSGAPQSPTWEDVGGHLWSNK